MGAREDRGQRTEDGRWNEEDTSVLCRLSSVVCRQSCLYRNFLPATECEMRLEQLSAFATAHLLQSKTPDRRGRGLSSFCRMSSKHADFAANCAAATHRLRRSFLDDYLLKPACPPARQLACCTRGLVTGFGARNFEFSLYQSCSQAQKGQYLRANGPELPVNCFGSTSIPMNM